MKLSGNNDKNTPLVSIIMTTYNRGDFIIESINSIQAQTYLNWELIIVDEGSSDDTEKKVKQLNEPRIIYITQAHNGISGRAKNLALQNASGDYIAFNDSDDLWHATKLEKQLDAFTVFPAAGFCVTNGYNFYNANEKLDHFYKNRTGNYYGSLFNAYFSSELAGFTQALLVRKKCMEQIGGFKEHKPFTDIDCIVSLAYSYPGIILYESLISRRLHNSNDSSQNWEMRYEEGIAILSANKPKLTKKIYRNSLARIYLNRGEKYLFEGNLSEAYKSFLYAWKIKPLSFIPAKKILKTVIHS